MIFTIPKAKTCRVCKTSFTPQRPLARVCSPICAKRFVDAENANAEKVAKVKDKRETKAKLEKHKTRGQWLAETKTAIQQARRLEELDKGRGCMSCKRTQQEVEAGAWRPGGYWDGGHFLSKGARPELALEPLNIWLQCKSCNAGSSKYARKGYTVNASFEANLIEAEGQELVDWLKGPHELKHYDIDDLKAIKAAANAKTKQLKAGQA